MGLIGFVSSTRGPAGKPRVHSASGRILRSGAAVVGGKSAFLRRIQPLAGSQVGRHHGSPMIRNRSAPSAQVTPVLIYEDVGRAVDWLCEASGPSLVLLIISGRPAWRGPASRAR